MPVRSGTAGPRVPGPTRTTRRPWHGRCWTSRSAQDQLGDHSAAAASTREAVPPATQSWSPLDRDAHLPELARSLNNLANRLANRLAEAAAAPKPSPPPKKLPTCAGSWPPLNRDAYLPDLATSVNNLALSLADAGRRPEALTTAHEAVDLRRELVTLNRDAHLPDLAGSISNLARRLGETGHRAEALAAAREAAQLYRQSQQIHGDVYADHVSRAERLAATLADLDVEPDDLTGSAGP